MANIKAFSISSLVSILAANMSVNADTNISTSNANAVGNDFFIFFDATLYTKVIAPINNVNKPVNHNALDINSSLIMNAPIDITNADIPTKIANLSAAIIAFLIPFDAKLYA